MKHIVFTFDDGRSDNYYYAMPVLNKYSINATFFITTGYVDGSWNNRGQWKSSDAAMTIDQLSEMQKCGMEIGLHGDRHITDAEDFTVSYNKITRWGLAQSSVGFSIPSSRVDTGVLKDFYDRFLGKEAAYIRSGRQRDTSALSSKILFGMYSALKFSPAYNAFNSVNLSGSDIGNIKSVVIRYNDNPDMILKFIDSIPDGECCVFMLHSILPSSSPLLGADAWCWSEKSFEALCKGLAERDDTVMQTMMNSLSQRELIARPKENVRI